MSAIRPLYVLPYMQPGSVLLVERIKEAIDDWAEREMDADFSYGRGYQIGRRVGSNAISAIA